MTRDSNVIAKIIQDIALKQNWLEVYNLADYYREQQQWQLAAVAFTQATKLKPDSFWSYHHLGDALSQLKQWQKAAIAYSHSVKLDDNFFWSWHNLGNALIKLQRWQEAAQAYGQALRLDGNFFWSWYGRGNALIQLNLWDQAILNYLQAVQLEPQHQLSYQKLGIAFKQRGSLNQSIKDYRQIINSPPNNSFFQLVRDQPRKLLDLANILYSQHQITGAIIISYMLLEIQPNQAEILKWLSQLTHQHNQLANKIVQQQHQIQGQKSSQILTRSTSKAKVKPKTKYPIGQITLQKNCLVLSNQIEDLCSAVGWVKRPLEKVNTALKQSFIYVCAWYTHNEKRKLIGFARAVADGAFNAMLLDIVVHPDFQGQGIGKKIVNNLVIQLRQSEITDITLFAAPHMVDFYHKLGFVAQPHNLNWMLYSI